MEQVAETKLPHCGVAGRNWWQPERKPRSSGKYVLLLSTVFLLYFLSGKLGLAVPFTSANVSPVWPAAGVGLAAILMWGGQMFPAVVAAAFLVNYLTGLPLGVAAAIGLGNTASALVGSYLLARIPDFQFARPRLRDVLHFVLVAGIAGSSVAPTVGVTALTLAHIRSWSGYNSAWAVWWLGDAMGVLVVTPLFLSVGALARSLRGWRAVELTLLLLGLLGASMFIFGPHVALRDDVLAFIVFPFVLWATIRFGWAGAAVTNAVVAAVAVWGTAHGSGPFVAHAPLRNAELLQLFIAVPSLTSLMLAGVINEREQIEQAFEVKRELLKELAEAQTTLTEAHFALETRVRERTAELERKNQKVAEQAELLDLANDAILLRSLDHRITYWNRGAERLYGWTREEVLGGNVQSILQTEYPIPFTEIRDRVLRSGSWQGELRQTQRDGTRITVESRWSVWLSKEGKALGFLELNTNVTERKRAEESLRDLSGRLLTLQDGERRRIARELHDSAGQMIVALNLNLAAIQAESARLSPRAQEACRESLELVREMSSEIRTLSHLLHPPLLDEAGLPSALGWYVDGFAQRSKVSVDLDLSPDLGRFTPEMETAIFRIVQECLTNIHRHSQSPTALIRVKRNGQTVEVEVQDEGKGMPTPEGMGPRSKKQVGIGIQGMRERVSQLGGTIQILSDKKGTLVRAQLPLNHETWRTNGELPEAS